jgi:lipoyl-dependent peroxiredoxin
MPLAQRRAEVTWEGNLVQGNGKVTTGTGVLSAAPVTWASRTERPNGKTSPEELIAAAHAACYAMAFSHTLASNDFQPTRLHVNAVCTLDRVEGGVKITMMELQVAGVVPGLDQAAFAHWAEVAEKGCPVSNALRGNVQISVQAKLETA